MKRAAKPKLLICATPIYGHVMPIRAIAKELIARDYEVTFLCGSEYKEKIEHIGATFIPLIGDADITEVKIARMVEEFIKADPPPPDDEVMRRGFIEVIPDQHEGVQRALEIMTKKEPEARIVILFEGAFRGSLPTLLGAGEIHPIGHIGLGIVPISLSSIDTPPWGPGNPPDSSEEGRIRNRAANEKNQQETFAKSQLRFEEILRDLGATVPGLFWRDTTVRLADRFVQMCAPSIEYPRSDAPSTLRFAGGLGPGLRDPMTSFPGWWDDIAVNPAKKHIVAVSQGTLAIDPNELIIPTMLAFKDSNGVIVVAALGKKGATLPEGFLVPENTRYADFIPYDEMLQYSEVFVTNGGYGSVQHGLSHGVPLVVGGIRADKPENAMRVEWSGAGKNLRTHTPTPEMVYQAVTEVLEDPKYKTRAKEIQAEMQSYDPVGVVVENIEVVVNSK